MPCILLQVKGTSLGIQIDSHSGCTPSSCFFQPKTFILGFSKGGTVLNQLVTELGFSDIGSIGNSSDEIHIVPKTKESFLNSVTEIHYVDVGLNCTGAYPTDPNVIERISNRIIRGAPGIRFILHGTPRQWGDSRRGWIRNEKDRLIHLLESEALRSEGKLQVYERYYFADRNPNLQMHFEIIENLDVS